MRRKQGEALIGHRRLITAEVHQGAAQVNEPWIGGGPLGFDFNLSISSEQVTLLG